MIELEPLLDAPCYPAPSLKSFDLLNNKWRFTQLCEQLAIRCPRTMMAADRGELLQKIDSGERPVPFIAKPLDSDGSTGVVLVRSRDQALSDSAIDYSPILVQDYIEGEDIGASVYCDEGRIHAFVAHRLKRATYSTFQSDEIQGAIARIVAATGARGVLNFDMRLGRDNAIYWLECNPRFFYKMYLSMLAGVDFAPFGLPEPRENLRGSLPTGAGVRTFKAIFADLARPWRLTAQDWAYVRYIAADPVPNFREAIGVEFEIDRWPPTRPSGPEPSCMDPAPRAHRLLLDGPDRRIRGEAAECTERSRTAGLGLLLEGSCQPNLRRVIEA